jgi:hypothetical protein
MPAHRKTLKELAESGTLQRHLGTYKGRIEAQKAKDALIASVPDTALAKGTRALPKRAPGHFSKEAKAAWREIVASAPEGSLVASDALQLEITAKLLVKSRTQDLKPTTMNQLAIQLAKWSTKGQDVPSAVTNPTPAMPSSPVPETELSDWEKFSRDDDEDQRREALIRDEIVRRKETGPLPGQTEKEFEYSCRWYEVGIDLTKQHGWNPLYLD